MKNFVVTALIFLVIYGCQNNISGIKPIALIDLKYELDASDYSPPYFISYDLNDEGE